MAKQTVSIQRGQYIGLLQEIRTSVQAHKTFTRGKDLHLDCVFEILEDFFVKGMKQIIEERPHDYKYKLKLKSYEKTALKAVFGDPQNDVIMFSIVHQLTERK